MLDLLTKQKMQVTNAEVLYRASHNHKQQVIDIAQTQSKEWISSPKGLLASFAAGSCYGLQSSSHANSSRTIMTILLRFV